MLYCRCFIRLVEIENLRALANGFRVMMTAMTSLRISIRTIFTNRFHADVETNWSFDCLSETVPDSTTTEALPGSSYLVVGELQ